MDTTELFMGIWREEDDIKLRITDSIASEMVISWMVKVDRFEEVLIAEVAEKRCSLDIFWVNISISSYEDYGVRIFSFKIFEKIGKV